MRRDLDKPDVEEDFGHYTLRIYNLQHDESLLNLNSPAGRAIWGPAVIRVRIWECGKVFFEVKRIKATPAEHQIRARGK